MMLILIVPLISVLSVPGSEFWVRSSDAVVNPASPSVHLELREKICPSPRVVFR